jgi:hypothetical protein
MASLFNRHIAKLLPSLTWRHFGVGALQAYLSEDGRLEQRLHIWHPSLIRSGIQGRGDCHNHRFSFVSQVLCGAIVNEQWDLRAFEAGDYALYEVEHARAALQRTGAFDCDYRLVARCHAAPIGRTWTHGGGSYEFERGAFHRTSCLGLTVTLVTKFDQQEERARILCPHGERLVQAFGGPKPDVQAVLRDAQEALCR